MNNTAITRRNWLKCVGASLVGLAVPKAISGQDPVTVPATHGLIRELSGAAPLSMQFRGKTAEQCRRWQAEFSAKLRELLGPYNSPENWKVHVERRVTLEDHTREELVLFAPGHPRLPVYLLLPKGKDKRPRPAVLALHGHGKYGHDPVAGRDELPGVAAAIEKANYDYGRQFVRRGYVVAAPCMTPFGRRLESREAYGSDPCAVTFVRMQLLGKVLMAENLRDCLWAFELLSRHQQVDNQRIGCVGLSYGGRMTMLTSALEPRIRVAVPSGALNVMQERIRHRYSCGAQVIPGLLKFGDVPEIGSLIAPRHCVWETGTNDGLIIPDWAERALKRMRRAYAALDAEDRLQIDRFEGGHQWSGRVAFPLLEKILQPQA